MESKETYIKVIASVSFAAMIVINILANVVPFNGMTTVEISDLYPTLFTPADYTFSIWGVIYVLLALFSVYQMDLFHKNPDNQKMQKQIRKLFIILNFSNAGWILAWHYEFMALSVMLIVIILICLILVNMVFQSETLTNKDKLFIRLPFRIYFGWITVATVSNIAALLVSVQWGSGGIKKSIWTIIILIAIMVFVVLWSLLYSDTAYCITIIWAFAGLLVKHISLDGFNQQYPEIINTILILECLLLVEVGYISFIKE